MNQLYRWSIALIAFLLIHADLTRAQWVQCPSLTSSAVESFGVKGPYLFAGTDGDGSYRSTDNGGSWTRMTSGLTNNTGFAFLTIGPFLLLGNSAGVYRSSDDGVTWSFTGPGFLMSRSFLVDGNRILTCGDGGIYTSADSGAHWARTDTGMTGGYHFALAASGGAILDASNGYGIWRSTDGGLHWAHSSTGLTDAIVESIVADGPLAYAGTLAGIFRSTDGGQSWGLISETNIGGRGMALIGSRLYVATQYHGVIFTDDQGGHWTSANTGFDYIATMNAFGVVSGALWVGSYGNGMWYRPFGEFIESVPAGSVGRPLTARLMQNYPNPFNPATTLSFDIPVRSQVELRVFDMLGRQVALLAEGVYNPGTYEAKFDGSACASGVYLCRLKSDATMQTRKLILQR